MALFEGTSQVGCMKEYEIDLRGSYQTVIRLDCICDSWCEAYYRRIRARMPILRGLRLRTPVWPFGGFRRFLGHRGWFQMVDSNTEETDHPSTYNTKDEWPVKLTEFRRISDWLTLASQIPVPRTPNQARTVRGTTSRISPHLQYGHFLSSR